MRDVRLESGMRSEAAECTPDTLSIDVRAGANFRNALKLICLSSRAYKNNPLPFRPKSPAYPWPSRSGRGALAIVTNVGMGCGGRGLRRRARRSQGELCL